MTDNAATRSPKHLRSGPARPSKPRRAGGTRFLRALMAVAVVAQLLIVSGGAQAAGEIETWGAQPSPSSTSMRSVAFPTETTGFAVGGDGGDGQIWVTRDGGATWAPQALPQNPASPWGPRPLDDVSFVDEQTGYAVGMGGFILRTEDGGNTWVALTEGLQSAIGLDDFMLSGVSFVPGGDCGRPACFGYVVGHTTNPTFGRAGIILATKDGGQTWVLQFVGRPRVQPELNDVSFVDQDHGVAVGNDGLILRTSDGGTTWSPRTDKSLDPSQLNPTDEWLGISMVDRNHGFAAGTLGVIATQDGGATWAPAQGAPAWNFYSVAASAGVDCPVAPRPCHATAVGSNGYIATTHDGQTWTRIHACAVRTASCAQTSSDRVSSELFGVAFASSSECPPDWPACKGLIVGGSGTILKNHLDSGPPQPPIITGFSPTRGPQGTEVVITGANFRNATVRFNGLATTSKFNASFTSLTAVVPEGATSGPITVETTVGSAQSAGTFTVEPTPPPQITSFSPTEGGLGYPVTITGHNLKSASVTFNGTPATEVSSTFTSVTAEVPAGATTGPITVATKTGVATTPTDFVVYIPPGPSAPAEAEAVDSTHATLTWRAAAEDGNSGGRVTRYQIRHATFPLSEESFNAEGVVKACNGGDCSFSYEGDAVGDKVSYVVPDLAPGRTHYFAVRALDLEGEVGPVALAGPVSLPEGIGAWQDAGAAGGGTAHTATLLPNGKVLVAGGCAEFNPGNMTDCRLPLASANLYDPTTGTFNPVDPMNKPRWNHTATLLADGSVLVAGGGWGDISAGLSAEIYKDGTWTTVTPDSLRWMSGHSATLLENGKVLITGGFGSDIVRGVLWFYLTVPGYFEPIQIDRNSSADVFDPDPLAPQARWAPSPPLLEERAGHTMTMLRGSAEKCGLHCGKILVVGSDAKTELYDPATRTTVFAGNLSVPRELHSATQLPDGRVLIAGGTNRATGAGAPVAEIFDPKAPLATAWSTAGKLDVGRRRPGSALLPSGKVLIAEGPVGDVFDPESNKWHSTNALNIPRPPGVTATVLSADPDSFEADPAVCGANCGKVLLVGGAARAELYTEPPTVTGIAPATGKEGTVVTIKGTGFTTDLESDPEAVLFGSVPATSFSVDSYNQITAVAPGLTTLSSVPVSVVTAGGMGSSTEPFTYEGAPGTVTDLAAQPVSATEASLTFSATGLVGNAAPAAANYTIKQSETPITSQADFDVAKTLCSGRCNFDPSGVGARLTLAVTDLRPTGTYFYALRAEGSGVSGPLSNVAQLQMPSVAPGSVADLVATPKSPTEVALSFSAPPAFDGGDIPADRFVVKQAQAPINDEESFQAARALCEGACTFSPVAVGDRLTLRVTDLVPGTSYSYALRPVDDAGVMGPLSNVARATTPAVAVGRVTDLAASAVSKRSVRLTFSAPASERGVPAKTYEIRQSRKRIGPSTDAFESARALCGGQCRFSPSAVGHKLTLEVTELSPSTKYFYALRAVGIGGQTGPVSNVVKAKTSGRKGKLPRGAIRDLKAKAKSPTSIVLRFSAPRGPRGSASPPGRYIVKQSRQPIRGRQSFKRALSLCPKGICIASPKKVGEELELPVTDLRPGMKYFYRVVALYKGGGSGPPSNAVRVKTPAKAAK